MLVTSSRYHGRSTSGDPEHARWRPSTATPLAPGAAATADHTVTILAEHRPGSSDLFVLTLDICPGP